MTGGTDAKRLRQLLAAMPDVGGDGLMLVGGAASDGGELSALLNWLGARPAQVERWWRCLEWTDCVRLEQALPELPEHLSRLLWGRWFGEAADLELWREGEAFRWRVIAGPGDEPPGIDTRLFDTAGADGPAPLRRGAEVTAYLWGAKEGQVGTADAATLEPLLRAPGRATLRYTPYYDRGALAAVWYHGIDSVEGEAPPSGSGGSAAEAI